MWLLNSPELAFKTERNPQSVWPLNKLEGQSVFGGHTEGKGEVVLVCVKGRALMQNGSKDRRQATLLEHGDTAGL